jgi:hypothetical protein
VGAELSLGPVTSVLSHREPATGTVVPAAASEAPAATSNSQTANIAAASSDPRKSDTANAGTARVVIDPQTNAVVYQSLDASTGDIVAQVPSQALLRQRVYADAQAVQALLKGKSFDAAAVAAAQEVDTTT